MTQVQPNTLDSVKTDSRFTGGSGGSDDPIQQILQQLYVFHSKQNAPSSCGIAPRSCDGGSNDPIRHIL